MSIKIYNGITWPTNDVFEVADKVRAVMLQAHTDLMVEAVAVCAVETAAKHLAGEGPARFNGILDAEQAVRLVVKAADASPLRSGVDFASEVTILRHDSAPDALFGMVHASIGSTRQAVTATGDEYCYWNNTDRPDNLTEADWEQRRQVWSDILHGFNSAPASVGVSVRVNIDSRMNWVWTPDYRNPGSPIRVAVEKILTGMPMDQPRPPLDVVLNGTLRTAASDE